MPVCCPGDKFPCFPGLTYFILYSRSYCHLCDDMLQALQALPQAVGLTVEVIDIDVDADESLLHAYDERVPVLVGVGLDGARRDAGPRLPRAALSSDPNNSSSETDNVRATTGMADTGMRRRPTS